MNASIGMGERIYIVNVFVRYTVYTFVFDLQCTRSWFVWFLARPRSCSIYSVRVRDKEGGRVAPSTIKIAEFDVFDASRHADHDS